jgi:CheY-like chemotaxis protein
MKTDSSLPLSSVRKRPPPAAVVPVALVAHGLNNTLTVINGFSELLLGVMSECDPRRRYAEEIQRAGQRAAELTQQLLARAGQRPSSPPAKASPASRALRDLSHDHSGHETILLVEDDEAVRDTVGHQLVALGYSVLEASGGPEALRVVAAQPARRIDLLLTDVVMLGMDGCMLAAHLRERRPGLKVVFSSGYAREAVLWQSPRPGSDGFLPKPYDAAALVHAIHALLGETPADDQPNPFGDTNVHAKTFRQACCEKLGIPVGAFEETVLWQCLPPLHVPLGKLRWRFNQAYFKDDLEAIRSVADCTNLHDLFVRQLYHCATCPISGWQRRFLHARLSGRRLLNFASQLLPPSEAAGRP